MTLYSQASAISILLATSVIAQNSIPATIPTVQEWNGAEGTLAFKIARITTTGDGSVVKLLRSEKGDAKNGSKLNLKLQPNKHNAKKGSYAIKIDDEVTISAYDQQGLFYGTRTLLQLMAQGDLPKGIIKDHPSYRVRSVMLDVGRKFMPIADLKDWIRAMSYVKLNQLHLHLNDSIGLAGGFRLEIKSHPRLASKDGHYTQQQIKDLQLFAKQHGVTIVPEIDAPAHATGFTQYRPDLTAINQRSQDLDLSNPDTYKLLEDVLGEVADLFESKHIHIGTDELRLHGIKDKKRRDELGELFRQYINRMNAFLKTKGKVTRIWSGYEHMPGKTQPAKDVIIDMWVSDDANLKIKQGYAFINSNHGYTYIVPGTTIYGINNANIYNNWAPNFFSSKKGGTIPQDTPNLLGGKFHIWNDIGDQSAGYTNLQNTGHAKKRNLIP